MSAWLLRSYPHFVNPVVLFLLADILPSIPLHPFIPTTTIPTPRHIPGILTSHIPPSTLPQEDLSQYRIGNSHGVCRVGAEAEPRTELGRVGGLFVDGVGDSAVVEGDGEGGTGYPGAY